VPYNPFHTLLKVPVDIVDIKKYHHFPREVDRPMKRYPCLLIFAFLIFIFTLGRSALAEKRFTDNNNGTITDHQLGLMWAATDNLGDITWHQAEKWVRFTFPFSLSVQYEDWRLPSLDELKSLYVRDPGYHGYESDCGQILKITPEIRLSCGFVWSGDRDGVSAYVFNFKRGTFYSDRLVHNRGYRALAVRTMTK
jgi:hypothetical protein